MINDNTILFKLNSINKIYGRGDNQIHALRNVDLTIHQGDRIAFVGPSGSGKTTLLHLLSLMERPSSGSIEYQHVLVQNQKENELRAIRLQKFGFVFQSFNLLPTLNAYDNIRLLSNVSGRFDVNLMELICSHLGIASRLNHYPHQLSGGEQQRVAIARALLNRPEVLFADEPTGNLDSKTSIEIMDVLTSTLHNAVKAFAYVTHNSELIRYASRVIRIQDGELYEE